jgi:hypothetical protein
MIRDNWTYRHYMDSGIVVGMSERPGKCRFQEFVSFLSAIDGADAE